MQFRIDGKQNIISFSDVLKQLQYNSDILTVVIFAKGWFILSSYENFSKP